MIKKILIAITLLFSFSSCSSKKIISIIGNEFISQEKLTMYNSDFIFKKIESKSLLRILDENMENEASKNDIKDVIKKSEKLILSIGLFDLLKCVSLIDGNLKFDFKESILELFELNLFNIVEKIYEYNYQVKICLVSLYNPYPNERNNFYLDMQKGIEKYNQAIEEFSQNNQISFYDISKYSSSILSFNKLSEEGETSILKGLIEI